MAAWRQHERFVVMRWLRGVPQFWTGTYWSCEYPDALLFSSLPKAERLADELEGVVAENYGTEVRP
ncbi:hypothetical protein FBQ96_03000 [Nitrospirales bacterium NOB]|nr:MAG: hypothetical protein UZ03_NOB001001873 [Nitrospira sp. OLB3]MDL1888545.1 hypothetical protein [Nitrospirales bacterium NOB]